MGGRWPSSGSQVKDITMSDIVFRKAPYLELKGSEHVEVHELVKGRSDATRVYWEDVPPEFRVTEEMVRSSQGAHDPKWLNKRLRTYGCGRASYYRDDKFIRCSNKLANEGFCSAHTKSAIKDKKLTEEGVRLT